MTAQAAGMPHRIGNAIYGADPFVTKWVNERILQSSPLALTSAAIGFLVPGTESMGAGIIFYDYSRRDITVGIAISDRRAVNRDMIAHCVHYPFRQLGCERVTIYVDKRNRAVRQVADRFGFVLEGTKRGTDVCMYGLLAKDAERWIRDIV